MHGQLGLHTASGRIKVDDILRMDILSMSDRIQKKIVDLEKPYRVNIVDRSEWDQGAGGNSSS